MFLMLCTQLFFTDNTTLFISGKSVDTPNFELQKVNEWLEAKTLSLNTKDRLFLYTIKLLRKLNCLWLFQY